MTHTGGEPSEPSLLGHFIRTFTGLSTADSAELSGVQQRHITRLENPVRWTWACGDIAIWDNRATQQYAVADYDDRPRLMHRITATSRRASPAAPAWSQGRRQQLFGLAA